MKRNPMGAKRVSALLVAALLLLQVTAYAFPFPVPEPISSAEELRAWYGSGGSCTLTEELVVADTLRLDAEKGGDIEGGAFGIRVAPGGHLIVDSESAVIFGVHADDSPLIYVEAGGSLTLQRGQIFGDWGNYSAKTVVLEADAALSWGADFHVEGGVWAGDELQPAPTPEPMPEPEPTPEPEPDPAPAPIADLSVKILPPAGGEMTVELQLPQLPQDATALYIEHQPPENTWQRATHSEGDNFISQLHLNNEQHYVAFRLAEERGITQFRVEVEGSRLAGVSNVIATQPQSPDAPPQTDWDDGSNGGNRGGGGQGESDRTPPKAPSAQPKPAPKLPLTPREAPIAPRSAPALNPPAAPAPAAPQANPPRPSAPNPLRAAAAALDAETQPAPASAEAKTTSAMQAKPPAAEPKATSAMQAETLAAAPADAAAAETPSAASTAADHDAKSESPVSAGVFYVIAGSALVVAGVSIGIYRRYKRNRAARASQAEDSHEGDS